MAAGSLVYFELETTNIRPEAEITQIAAVWRDQRFNQYVLPYGEISEGATYITGIEKDIYGEALLVDGEEVSTVSTHTAIYEFIDWLYGLEVGDDGPVLVAHNAHEFDIPRLFNNAETSELDSDLEDALWGYVDTLPLFRYQYPYLNGYKLCELFHHFGVESYEPHNALEDARALRALLKRTGLYRERYLVDMFSFSF